MKRHKTRLFTIGALAVGVALLGFAGFKARGFSQRTLNAPGFWGEVIARDVNDYRSGGRYGHTYRDRATSCSFVVAWKDDQGQTHRKRFAVEDFGFYENHAEGSEVRLASIGEGPEELVLVQPSAWMPVILLALSGLIFSGFGAALFLANRRAELKPRRRRKPVPASAPE